MLVQRNIIDFVNLGHILTSSQLINYFSDLDKLDGLLNTYKSVMNNDSNIDEEAESASKQ